MYPTQSSIVTVVKLANRRVFRSVMCGSSIDIVLRLYFTFENTSSIGLRSGEYGGRNRTRAPTSSIAFLTS